MWAGGELTVIRPLLLGSWLQRQSRVESVAFKESARNGRLAFVTVSHRVLDERGVALEERHEIVFKQAQPLAAAEASASRRAAPAAAAAAAAASAPRAEAVPPTWRQEACVTPAALFMYSALTYNAHRIHFDPDYCRTEGYDNLVVHGPLTVTLLCALFQQHFPSLQHHLRVSYRARAPLFAGQRFALVGWPDAAATGAESGGALPPYTLEARGDDGSAAMTVRVVPYLNH